MATALRRSSLLRPDIPTAMQIPIFGIAFGCGSCDMPKGGFCSGKSKAKSSRKAKRQTNVIHDEAQFASVIEEIAAWTLQQRRDYIDHLARAFGPESAQQIKDGLTARWNKR